MTAKDCGLAALTIPSCAFATASSMSLANEGILTDMRINDAIRDSRLASNAVLLPDPRTGCLYDDLVAAGMKAGKIEDADVAGLHDSSDTGLSVGSSDFCARHRSSLGVLDGLSRVKDGVFTTLTSRNGLPCDAINSVIEDNDHSLWLYMACGLVRIARPELDAWAADPKRTIQVTVFDSSDGVRSRALAGGHSRLVAKSPDGKIWFSPPDGVSVIDPRHLPFNKLPPPVYVQQITADGKKYDASPGLRLPPRIRDLTIDYTALSLVAPEKVRFRFKLEGQDPDWKEVVNDRRAQYSNLPPGNYQFRVTACNNSGVWNEAGTFLDFSIAPAYWQTTWFRLACLAAFALLLWALYRLRLRQVARQFEMTLEARVSERTRIARDLHDTVLQSFHGLLLRFQTVDNMLPERPAEAKQRLESAIDQAAEAITEGRDAVQGLRSSTVETNDLAEAIGNLAKELAANVTGPDVPAFRLDIGGAPQSLHPILRDEVYRIGGEALRNAFRHAEARRVEVEIQYEDKRFRLRVRDDGKGIDPKFLNQKRAPGTLRLAWHARTGQTCGG